MSKKSKFCSTCNSKVCLAHYSLWGRNICIESDGPYFCISFKERMRCDDKKAYVFCAQLNDFLSCSTFERHEGKRNGKILTYFLCGLKFPWFVSRNFKFIWWWRLVTLNLEKLQYMYIYIYIYIYKLYLYIFYYYMGT